jgi:hypothetical protein
MYMNECQREKLYIATVCRYNTAHAANKTEQLPLDGLGAWWFWALAALCAGGVTGFIMAVYACLTGSSVLYQVGVQATYICALGVILWRMKDALQAHLAGVMSSTFLFLYAPKQRVSFPFPSRVPTAATLFAEARNLIDGQEQENVQLRAVVASLKQQLEDAKDRAHTYTIQAEEMRAQSSTAGKAGQELHQQVRIALEFTCQGRKSMP